MDFVLIISFLNIIKLKLPEGLNLTNKGIVKRAKMATTPAESTRGYSSMKISLHESHQRAKQKKQKPLIK